MTRFQAPRGTHDILPSESHRWQRLETVFRELAELYGYREIRTPAFEDYELFARTSGETIGKTAPIESASPCASSMDIPQ